MEAATDTASPATAAGHPGTANITPDTSPLPHDRHAFSLRLRQELRICSAGLRRIAQARARREKAVAVASSRDWRQARRARTRLLIEYGGLVVKAGLAELVDDDRATLLGAFLGLRDQFAGSGDETADTYRQRYRRRGLRAFDADAAARKEGGREEGERALPG